MTPANRAAIQSMLAHIRALAVDIGPRGSTTEGERRGAEYCQASFERVGLSPQVEHFSSAVSIFHPHLLAAVCLLAAFAIYPLGGRLTAWLAAFISLVALATDLMELGFQNNLFRLLVPKGQSQNVLAVIPPSKEHLQDLILIGHIDTQRTPLIFKTPRWVSVYKNFTTIAVALFVFQIILFILGALTGWVWPWLATIPSAVCAVLLAAICIHADRTPYTAGANDNASAVAMVLALAERFTQQPLEHTRVYAVCTGSEEVQHFGAIDFFRRHRAEMISPRALVFEMLGCSGPGWLIREGIIIPFYSDIDLLRLAEQVNARYPQMGGYPVKINGGNSEMADCVRFNVPALTLFGLKPNGEAPYWHQVGDTFDKIDPLVLEKNYILATEMIRCLDQDGMS